MGRTRRKPCGKLDDLIHVWIVIGYVEILIKGHPARCKDQKRGAETHGTGCDYRDAQFHGAGKNHAPDFKHEKVEPINDQIHPVEEVVHIVRGNTFRIRGDIEIRIDLPGIVDHGRQFFPTKVGNLCPVLPIDIDRIEPIKISHFETTNACSGKGNQMPAPHATKTGYGYGGILEACHFIGVQQAQVSAECRFVIGFSGVERICFENLFRAV